jgi:class 3 adenylate cyclase
LTRQLEAEPDLLEGKDAEISVLFCDVRGFSRISERLGPAGAALGAWIELRGKRGAPPAAGPDAGARP